MDDHRKYNQGKYTTKTDMVRIKSLPIKWMTIESITKGKYTTKTDVVSIKSLPIKWMTIESITKDENTQPRLMW